MTFASKEIIEKLIYAGSLAPSPENNQPWHFTVHDDHLNLQYVPSRAIDTDQKHILNLLSLGAAVENVKIQASEFGYSTSWKLNQESINPSIQIYFVNTCNKVDPLINFIARRQTNRHPFIQSPLELVEVEHLQNSFSDIGEIHLNIFRTTNEKQKLASVFRVFDQIRFSYKLFHAEMVKSLRYSKAEFHVQRQGLNVQRLGLPIGGTAFLKFLSSWPIFRALNFLGLSKLFARMTEVQMNQSGALIVISAPSMDVKDNLCAGQVMQRVWLTATERGLSVQPFGHAAIFNNIQNEKVISEKKHQRRLAEGLEALNQQLALTENYVPLITLRVGYAKKAIEPENIRFAQSEITTWLTKNLKIPSINQCQLFVDKN